MPVPQQASGTPSQRIPVPIAHRATGFALLALTHPGRVHCLITYGGQLTKPSPVRTALSGLTQPLFGVFSQQIAQRDATAPGLGREPLGKLTGKDDGAVDTIVALPALVAQFRQTLSSPIPASQRLRPRRSGEGCGR